MLVQWTRREVPGHDAFAHRALIRQPGFCVSVMRSSGIAHDWGIQAEGVRYMARLTRTQLSILLAGRGYFAGASGLIEMAPGDVIESDQRLQEPEGYAGSPCEVVVIEWDHEALFGAERRGSARHSRIGPADVARLRALVAALPGTPIERWILELASALRAIGLGVARGAELEPAPPARAARIYGVLGDALSRLERQPSLGEVAGALSLSERQANRDFKELARAYAHPHDGWRDFLSDARVGVAMQLLSVEGLSMERVAHLSGYGSSIALSHAFAARCGSTPGSIARRLAQRWR